MNLDEVNISKNNERKGFPFLKTNLGPILAELIYVSDLEDWLEFAIAVTYADDTSTSVSG